MKHIVDLSTRGSVEMTQETSKRLGMRHPGTIDLYHHWSHLRAGRVAPYRAEFTPEGFGRSLAANTFILEDQGEGHMRFRLAGAALYDIFGMELRGMSAASVMHESDKAKFRALSSTVLLGARIAVGQIQLITVDGETLSAEILLAPMKNEFDQINRVLGAVHVHGDALVDAKPRRCHLIETRIEDLTIGTGAPSLETAPLAGFGEPRTAFDHSRPSLTPIEGGNTATSVKRGHLRLVSNNEKKEASDD